MTNLEMVTQFAKAWNNLDASYIEPYLADEFRYSSQFVFSDITSKQEYLEYLNGKFRTIKTANAGGHSFVIAEIGYYQETPCLLLMQMHDEPKYTGTISQKYINGKVEWYNVTSKVIETVLLFSFQNDKIISGDLCIIPSAYDVKRTGDMPK